MGAACSNKVLIFILADASGSMFGKRLDVVGGINAYLQTQRNLPGQAWVQMAQFNHGYAPMQGALALEQTQRFSEDRYKPGGDTALYDAIVTAIGAAEASNGWLRVDRIVFIVCTDGQENASKVTSLATVRRMIDEREHSGSPPWCPWTFIYLGASPTAFGDARAMGFQQANTAQYVDNGMGTQSAYVAASVATRSLREGNTVTNLGRALAEDELSTPPPKAA